MKAQPTAIATTTGNAIGVNADGWPSIWIEERIGHVGTVWIHRPDVDAYLSIPLSPQERVELAKQLIPGQAALIEQAADSWYPKRWT